MIFLIIGERQSGKSTYAMNKILIKRKEEFYFFCKNKELELFRHAANIPSNTKKRIVSQKTNYLKGRCGKESIEHVICDDYDFFQEDFRRDLLYYYKCGLLKSIFLFCSNEQTRKFVEIVNRVRDLNLNDYSSVERTNKINKMDTYELSFVEDVIAFPETVVINNIKTYVDLKIIDEVLKREIVKQRYEQNKL